MRSLRQIRRRTLSNEAGGETMRPWWTLLMLGIVRGASAIDLTKCSKQPSVRVQCPPVTSGQKEIKYQVLLQKNPSHKHTIVSEFEVVVNDDGVFTCKQEVIYPPPHREDCITTEVITEPLAVINVTEPMVTQNCPDTHTLVPVIVLWAVCGFLSLYGLILTWITVALWRKVKIYDNETLENHIYSNTKPQEKKRCKC